MDQETKMSNVMQAQKSKKGKGNMKTKGK